MSKTFCTNDQKRSRKRATIGAKYTSTPLKNIPLKHVSISLSGIDTASSSSEGGIERRLQSQIPEKRKKNSQKRTTDKRKRAVQSNTDSKETTDSEEPINEFLKFLIGKRKKSSKNKGKENKRKRIVDRSRDTDSEWITELEESISKPSTHSQGFPVEKCDDASKCIKLFEDLSPEKIRDAVYMESLNESPIIQFSEKLISRKNNTVQQNVSRSTSLPSTEIWNVEETNENELILNREKNPGTYFPAQKREKIPERRPENFKFPVRFPIATSNWLWDQFIEKHRKETSQHLASSVERIPTKSTDPLREDSFSDIPWKIESIPISPGMVCVSGYSDRISQKWVTNMDAYDRCNSNQEEDDGRKTKVRKRGNRRQKKKTTGVLRSTRLQGNDVYDHNATDIEFETGGRNGKRMTLQEFRNKQKINKITS